MIGNSEPNIRPKSIGFLIAKSCAKSPHSFSRAGEKIACGVLSIKANKNGPKRY